MTTEQKKQAVQAGTHLLENDGTIEDLELAMGNISNTITTYPVYIKYFQLCDIYWQGYNDNHYNLPTIPASTFFQDEADEPMITISVKRLEELVQAKVDNIESSSVSPNFKDGMLHGYKQCLSLINQINLIEGDGLPTIEHIKEVAEKHNRFPRMCYPSKNMEVQCKAAWIRGAEYVLSFEPTTNSLKK